MSCILANCHYPTPDVSVLMPVTVFPRMWGVPMLYKHFSNQTYNNNNNTNNNNVSIFIPTGTSLHAPQIWYLTDIVNFTH